MSKRSAPQTIEQPDSKKQKKEPQSAIKAELEVKFWIDIEKFKEKLSEVGATHVQERTVMKRKIWDVDPSLVPEGVQRWVRVRDEGKGKTTLTLKSMSSNKTITGTGEVEMLVGDFSACSSFLDLVGLKSRAYQENARDTWDVEGCQVTIDEWPGLRPFVEIEGESEELVYSVSEKLGFQKEDAMFGSIDGLYEKELGIASSVFIRIPSLTFENADEVLAKHKK